MSPTVAKTGQKEWTLDTNSYRYFCTHRMSLMFINEFKKGETKCLQVICFFFFHKSCAFRDLNCPTSNPMDCDNIYMKAIYEYIVIHVRRIFLPINPNSYYCRNFRQLLRSALTRCPSEESLFAFLRWWWKGTALLKKKLHPIPSPDLTILLCTVFMVHFALRGIRHNRTRSKWECLP
jgi:hypothetical protein